MFTSCQWYTLQETQKKKCNKTRVRCVRSGVHSALISILKGKSIPKKDRSTDEIAAYRIKQKPGFNTTVDVVRNPLTGKKEERVLVRADQDEIKTILLKKEEMEACVKMYHKKYKGAGTRKLYKSICKRFAGVSERDVASVVNTMHKAQRLKPTFMNKAPIHPVTSSSVMNQVQIDLVDMTSKKVTLDSETYRYILVLLDVFSRFLFLRPLKSKSSAEVAAVLLSIFSDIGPPRRLQSDQGSEFKGVVQKLMDIMQVGIIHSRPYHPQSQGKVRNYNIYIARFY